VASENHKSLGAKHFLIWCLRLILGVQHCAGRETQEPTRRFSKCLALAKRWNVEDAFRILASELASQLPADFTEAGKVIGYLDQLRHWRAGKSLVEQPIHSVVSFRREEVGAGNSPSLSPSRRDKPSVLPK
jgi:hypothetical protein